MKCGVSCFDYFTFLLMSVTSTKQCFKLVSDSFDQSSFLSLGRTILPNSFLGILSMKRTPPRSFSSSMTSPENHYPSQMKIISNIEFMIQFSTVSEIYEFLGGGSGIFPQHNKSQRPFTIIDIGKTDDTDLFHGWMCHHLLLNIGWHNLRANITVGHISNSRSMTTEL